MDLDDSEIFEVLHDWSQIGIYSDHEWQNETIVKEHKNIRNFYNSLQNFKENFMPKFD